MDLIAMYTSDSMSGADFKRTSGVYPPVIFAQLESKITSLAISPDGRRVIVSLDNGTLQLLDLINGTLIGQPFEKHFEYSRVTSVAFSPDGKTIISGSSDGQITLWSLNGKPIGQPFRGHIGGHIDSVKLVAFAPDGQKILSNSNYEMLNLWSLDGTPIDQAFQEYHGYFNAVAFSLDGKTIVSGSHEGTICICSLNGTRPELFKAHQEMVTTVAFSPDSQQFVSGSRDGTISLWNLDITHADQLFQRYPISSLSTSWSPIPRSCINSVAFSPNGQTIISGSDNGIINLWNLNGTLIGQAVQEFEQYYLSEQLSVNSVAFLPADGKTIISTSSSKIYLWSLNDKGVGDSHGEMTVVATPIRNLADRSRQISIPQGIANDLAQGDDRLQVKDEIDALAEVLMLRSLQPPVAVGILGNWGSGKSFCMYLIQQKINEIRSQSLIKHEAWENPDDPKSSKVLSPYVGHIYQIQFNAWTYAKSNLWASLMQEIFYNLNRQISLEQQLGHVLSRTETKTAAQTQTKSNSSRRTLQYLNQFIYSPLFDIKKYSLKLVWQIKKRALFFRMILDLWIFQLSIHVGLVLLVFVVIPTFTLLFLLQEFLFEKYLGFSLEIENTVEILFDWLDLEEQIKKYYFLDLDIANESCYERTEVIFERVLFFFFVGFPTRLRDRREFWEQELVSYNLDKLSELKSEDLIDSTPELDRVGQALREGGNFWQVLYLMNEEERNAFLKQNLNPSQFKDWQNLTTTSEISNSLWTALDQIKKEEQDQLKKDEEELQKKETTLQRQLKSAEVDVNQSLSRRAVTALWKPLINGLARLRFSKEEIEQFAASGKTFKMLRQTIKSWQGLFALFGMGIFLIVILIPDGWVKSLALIQQFLANIGLAKAIQPFISTWATNILPLSQAAFQWLQTHVPKWLQIVSATGVALIPTLKALSEYITSAQKEQARIQGERDGLLKQAQTKAEPLAKEVAQLKLQVEAQRQRLGLTANYSSLLDFVNARLDGDDYGKHLGLMQQVKQDLAALSDRLTVGAHNQEELKKFFPRGPARVILYIDDLDRCPPTRVVEVLEAAQLLLNTKLFIVVLGIDDRYIARALEEVYRGVLKRRGKPSGIDYLEKIIQIPYRMRPISPATIENYLRTQLQIRQPSGVEPTQPETKIDTPNQDSAEQQSVQNTQNLTDKNLAEPTPETSEIQLSEPTTPDEPSLDRTASRQDNPVQAVSQITPTPEPTPSASYLETVAQVTEFDEAEFQILVDCCKQVDITPRTAKRLINIYKILQIIWSTRSQKALPQTLPSDQDKRVVMSFLALSGRYPTFMRNLFEEIDALLEENNLDNSPQCKIDNPQIQIEMSELIQKIQTQFLSTADFHAQREWRKFTSDIQRMLKDPTQPKEKPVGLNLDRQTFELMLSFCFVGDIGYDPDDYSPEFSQER
jgi:WD40 repeat protein